MPFDIYAFADYSGSSSLSQQRKHIVLATRERPAEGVSVRDGLSRPELWLELCLVLDRATRQGHRVLFGFDHSYSFPTGFYEFLMREPLPSWRDLPKSLCTMKLDIPPLGEPLSDKLYKQLRSNHSSDPLALNSLSWLRNRVADTVLPRIWAKAVNERFEFPLPDYQGGPFWGPGFASQPTKPEFPFSEQLSEKRSVERFCQSLTRKTMKSIYQLGGNGSVGLQSLYGISYLYHLLSWSDERDIPVFCWPFDGWEVPPRHHVLVEVYPTLYNRGFRSDEEDAKACVTWAAQRDEADSLLKRPLLAPDDLLRNAATEGWVLGVGD